MASYNAYLFRLNCAQSSTKANSSLRYLRYTTPSKEYENTLPCSQEPTVALITRPDEFNQQTHTPFKIYFNSIHPA
jgi:hypothetical protein